jgi:hypothetical protein
VPVATPTAASQRTTISLLFQFLPLYRGIPENPSTLRGVLDIGAILRFTGYAGPRRLTAEAMVGVTKIGRGNAKYWIEPVAEGGYTKPGKRPGEWLGGLGLEGRGRPRCLLPSAGR